MKDIDNFQVLFCANIRMKNKSDFVKRNCLQLSKILIDSNRMKTHDKFTILSHNLLVKSEIYISKYLKKKLQSTLLLYCVYFQSKSQFHHQNYCMTLISTIRILLKAKFKMISIKLDWSEALTTSGAQFI